MLTYHAVRRMLGGLRSMQSPLQTRPPTIGFPRAPPLSTKTTPTAQTRGDDAPELEKRQKKSRTQTVKPSLRRVAVEAQRSKRARAFARAPKGGHEGSRKV